MVVARRKIRRATITHISLCKRGVNHQPVLMKSAGRVVMEMLTKAGKEGIVYALVYLPNIPDNEGDFASAEVVKAMAHDFLANVQEADGGIDIEHNFLNLGPDKVRLAETFIVQKGDPRFAGWKDNDGNPVNPEGSWGIALKVLDPALRADFESGALNGVSMYGHAELEAVGKAQATIPPTKNDKMTPEEIQALAVALAKAITPTPVQKAEAPKPEPVAFEGDPFNAEDVAKHAETLLFKSLDLSKPGDLAKWQAHLAKRAKPADSQDLNATEITRLEGEIARLKKASSAPAADGKPEGDVTVGNLQKSEAASYKAGRDAMRKFQGREAGK